MIGEARRHGAAGWKVNGAGGEGGTVSIIGPEDPDRVAALRSAVSRSPWRVLDLSPSTDGIAIEPLGED